MTPAFMPAKLLIIGAGAIGVEFASFYSTMGADVTLVEMIDQILPAEDVEIAEMARAAFEQSDIRVLTGTTIDALEKGKVGLTAVIGGQKQK